METLVDRKIVEKTKRGKKVQIEYELHKRKEIKMNTAQDYFIILKVKQDGKSLKNKYGGFPCPHVGAKDYIKKCWRNL